MRDLLTVAMILSVGFLTGDLILTHIPHHGDNELNWSQQTLRDPAQDGCPGQYHEYSQEFLISCWGTKESTDANDNVDVGNAHRDVHGRMDNTRDSLKEYER